MQTVIDMKVNGKMIIKMEKVFIIIQMVIDMKENLEAIKEKAKQFIIMQMVIEEWVII